MIITGDDKYNALNVAMNSNIISENSDFFLAFRDKDEVRFGYYSNYEVKNKLYSNRNISKIDASMLESQILQNSYLKKEFNSQFSDVLNKCR